MKYLNLKTVKEEVNTVIKLLIPFDYIELTVY